MRLYLDDDSIDSLLVRLLRNAGHDVLLPSDVGATGSHDAVHLRNAIHEVRSLLSGNHDDFEALHELVLEAGGHHHGILMVRRDNNPRRDMSQQGVVRAIQKLSLSMLPLADEFVILNHWR